MSAERPPERGSRSGKRRVTIGLAAVIAAASLAVGVVVGYVARGGPPDRVLVTTEQEIPVLTVTTQESAP